MKTVKIYFFIIPLVLAIGTVSLQAEKFRKSNAVSESFTEAELAALPFSIEIRTRYYLWDRKNPIIQKKMKPYIDKYGFGYRTIHHLGVGMMYLNRIKSNFLMKTPRKNFLIKSAISEFSFILDPVKRTQYNYKFIRTYLPSVFFKRGEAYYMMNQPGEALKDLYQVVKLKPAYYPAYVLMSQCYRAVGDVTNAKKILMVGEKKRKK